MPQLFRVLRGIAALVACALLHVASPVAAQAVKNARASVILQKEFDGFIAKFRAALKANDAAAVTELTRLPFFYDNSKIDAAQFRSRAYPAYFTANVRSCIQRGRAVYDRDGQNNDNFMIFCGRQIFIFTKSANGFLFAEVGEND